jgi:hypothetical protein
MTEACNASSRATTASSVVLPAACASSIYSNHTFDEAIVESSRSCNACMSLLSPSSTFVSLVAGQPSCHRRLPWLPQTKIKSTTTIVCKAHKGAQTSDVIKFLSVLTKHTGANCNQPVEPEKDWRSDCLAGQNLIVIELCGVLGR